MRKKIYLILDMIVNILLGIAIGSIVAKHSYTEEEKNWRKLSDKHLNLFLMMNQWIKIKQEGKTIVSYLIKNGCKNIAICGLSYVGETLLNELKGTEIHVAYGIDRNAEGIYADVDIVTAEDSLNQVDAVIVTAISDFEEIEEMLRGKLKCPIISLKDILYEI